MEAFVPPSDDGNPAEPGLVPTNEHLVTNPFMAGFVNLTAKIHDQRREAAFSFVLQDEQGVQSRTSESGSGHLGWAMSAPAGQQLTYFSA